MALPEKFQKKSTATPAAKAPAAAPRSRYAGVSASGSKYPFPSASAHKYLVRIVDAKEGFNPGKRRTSNKVDLEVVEFAGTEHVKGERLSFVKVGDNAATLGEVKRFVMAATGYEDENEYNEVDPEGFFIDAAFGASNDYSALFEGAHPLVGRLVYVLVTKGGDIPNSTDYYRNFLWEPCPEDRQEVPGLEAAIAAAS